MNEKKLKDSTSRNSQGGDQTSGPHVVSTHPSGNLVISIGTKVENKTSTSKKQSLESDVKQMAKYQKTKNAMNIVKFEDNQSSNGLKIIQKPNLYQVENKNQTTKLS